MSFIDRFFNSGNDSIEVFLPSEDNGAQWAKRFVMTVVAATAVATSAPWIGEKIEMLSIAQKMQSINGSKANFQEVSAAKDLIDFYSKFLSKGNGPGELRIEITENEKSAIFFNGGELTQTNDFIVNSEIFHKSRTIKTASKEDKEKQIDVLLPDICLLKISSADLQGLASLAKANPDQMDVRHTASGFGGEIYRAGELLASRTQCMLESQAEGASERLKMNEYINAASYAHATLLIGRQISGAAAHSFANTLGKIYGIDSPLSSGAARAANLLASGTLAYNSTEKPLVTLGIAMKLARFSSSDINEVSRVNDDDFANMLQKVTRVASKGTYPYSEAVFQIEGQQLAWKSGSIARGPSMGALHARLIDDKDKLKLQASDAKVKGLGS